MPVVDDWRAEAADSDRATNDMWHSEEVEVVEESAEADADAERAQPTVAAVAVLKLQQVQAQMRG